MRKWFSLLITPQIQKHWISDVLFFIPRFICGYLLTSSFGADKFGMPWSPKSVNLGLFEVVDWFPEDVANFGGIFSIAPVFFAWLGAASEAIGGLFLALGLGTRISAFFIMCTMLVAIFFQKMGQGVWGMLPAMGFLWVSFFILILGSGRFGLDYLISKKFNQ